MDFVGLLPRSKTRISSGPDSSVVIRDSVQLSTWICLGAVLQAVAYLAIGRLAFVPAASVLLYRVIDTYAVTTGLKRNPYMEDVVMKRYSAQFPDAQGQYGNKPSNSDVTVFLIGARANHPLGILAPGFKETGDYMKRMIGQIKENAADNGFLGSSSFLGNQRSSNNTVTTLMYFSSAAAVKAYAEGPLHREAWDWWNKVVPRYPHLGLFHEMYQVPRGHWETIYVQMAPLGAAATMHRVAVAAAAAGEKEGAPQGEEGHEAWMSPVVDASRGVLKSSAGRMPLG